MLVLSIPRTMFVLSLLLPALALGLTKSILPRFDDVDPEEGIPYRALEDGDSSKPALLATRLSVPADRGCLVGLPARKDVSESCGDHNSSLRRHTRLLTDDALPPTSKVGSTLEVGRRWSCSATCINGCVGFSKNTLSAAARLLSAAARLACCRRRSSAADRSLLAQSSRRFRRRVSGALFLSNALFTAGPLLFTAVVKCALTDNDKGRWQSDWHETAFCEQLKSIKSLWTYFRAISMVTLSESMGESGRWSVAMVAVSVLVRGVAVGLECKVCCRVARTNRSPPTEGRNFPSTVVGGGGGGLLLGAASSPRNRSARQRQRPVETTAGRTSGRTSPMDRSRRSAVQNLYGDVSCAESDSEGPLGFGAENQQTDGIDGACSGSLFLDTRSSRGGCCGVAFTGLFFPVLRALVIAAAQFAVVLTAQDLYNPHLAEPHLLGAIVYILTTISDILIRRRHNGLHTCLPKVLLFLPFVFAVLIDGLYNWEGLVQSQTYRALNKVPVLHEVLHCISGFVQSLSDNFLVTRVVPDPRQVTHVVTPALDRGKPEFRWLSPKAVVFSLLEHLLVLMVTGIEVSTQKGLWRD